MSRIQNRIQTRSNRDQYTKHTEYKGTEKRRKRKEINQHTSKEKQSAAQRLTNALKRKAREKSSVTGSKRRRSEKESKYLTELSVDCRKTIRIRGK